MTIDEAIQRLADFIKSLPDFRVYEQHEIETHDHIGQPLLMRFFKHGEITTAWSHREPNAS